MKKKERGSGDEGEMKEKKTKKKNKEGEENEKRIKRRIRRRQRRKERRETREEKNNKRRKEQQEKKRTTREEKNNKRRKDQEEKKRSRREERIKKRRKDQEEKKRLTTEKKNLKEKKKNTAKNMKKEYGGMESGHGYQRKQQTHHPQCPMPVDTQHHYILNPFMAPVAWIQAAMHAPSRKSLFWRPWRQAPSQTRYPRIQPSPERAQPDGFGDQAPEFAPGTFWNTRAPARTVGIVRATRLKHASPAATPPFLKSSFASTSHPTQCTKQHTRKWQSLSKNWRWPSSISWRPASPTRPSARSSPSPSMSLWSVSPTPSPWTKATRQRRLPSSAARVCLPPSTAPGPVPPAPWRPRPRRN
ncbi:hypothetical protein METBIDRAFT_147206 [Metschnikowia bicuspidata var. bicuspidata NRRL YB-4993]|uniref:Uncharacterized protein n=1 Tax=Metschnikowia bicuspidata var. bicuspidata NRRL YB-4993 TaxID=869754 RepID=A0A1A0HE08_9ASCO|nr:hypothetical protein METBIDRAFT_147206 [Metschnikowia bicuspidata var. bicuspidata NRRL YB-4993]OBA22138.1 hypothetical protein METBIDRAFT_147206 [Metschnikowia bicuspidata var. bicuspidata NRRL YB-4993]